GAEKSKAGCARRRTGKVPMDQGSIPCISKSAQGYGTLSVVGDELGGIKRLIPLCFYHYGSIVIDNFDCLRGGPVVLSREISGGRAKRSWKVILSRKFCMRIACVSSAQEKISKIFRERVAGRWNSGHARQPSNT